MGKWHRTLWQSGNTGYEFQLCDLASAKAGGKGRDFDLFPDLFAGTGWKDSQSRERRIHGRRHHLWGWVWAPGADGSVGNDAWSPVSDRRTGTALGRDVWTLQWNSDPLHGHRPWRAVSAQQCNWCRKCVFKGNRGEWNPVYGGICFRRQIKYFRYSGRWGQLQPYVPVNDLLWVLWSYWDPSGKPVPQQRSGVSGAKGYEDSFYLWSIQCGQQFLWQWYRGNRG